MTKRPSRRRLKKVSDQGRTADGDAVGYCKPPREHRWRRGQSGNPRGRPPKEPAKVRSIEEIVQELFNREVEIQQNGMTEKITYKEKICRNLMDSAAAGDKNSMQLLLGIEKKTPRVTPFETSADDDQELVRTLRELNFESSNEESS